MRMSRSWPALVFAGVALLSAPLLGHHSFGVYYLEQDTIEVEGEVVEFDYRNPHSWVHVAGKDAFFRMKIFSAEWASTSRLEQDGVTKRTLSVGDMVRIWASPSRNPNDNRIRIKRIERPFDHWKWGQNPRERR